MISANVRIEISPTDKILLRHHLAKNGDGQRFFTHEIRRMSDPYVPFDTGVLKNTATEKATSITYNAPYARRQWYTNSGSGQRGKQWCMRMWAARGHEIVKSVADFCGGKA